MDIFSQILDNYNNALLEQAKKAQEKDVENE